MSKESANYSELPRMIKPMLAQARSEPFNCDKHLFEVKWDGTRCLGFIEDDRIYCRPRRPRHKDLIGRRFEPLPCYEPLETKSRPIFQLKIWRYMTENPDFFALSNLLCGILPCFFARNSRNGLRRIIIRDKSHCWLEPQQYFRQAA